jgi:alkylation response protein AidB-like acyl-CoA dehydrogenase
VAAELALDTTRLGMHLHGALGLLLSSPIQRSYRRAAVEAARLGRVTTLWRELGARRLAGLVEAVE